MYVARQRRIPLRAERDKKERRLAEEHRAAAVLQSAARMRAARRAVARRHAEILESARRERGLLTIQVSGIHGMPGVLLSGSVVLFSMQIFMCMLYTFSVSLVSLEHGVM